MTYPIEKTAIFLADPFNDFYLMVENSDHWLKAQLKKSAS